MSPEALEVASSADVVSADGGVLRLLDELAGDDDELARDEDELSEDEDELAGDDDELARDEDELVSRGERHSVEAEHWREQSAAWGGLGTGAPASAGPSGAPGAIGRRPRRRVDVGLDSGC